MGTFYHFQTFKIPLVWLGLTITASQSSAYACGVFTSMLEHLHITTMLVCFIISNIFQLRHYRGRQPVLSGQLCPFRSLLGTAVIKRNQETGSNIAVKKKSLLPFHSPCFSLLLPCCTSFPFLSSLSLTIHSRTHIPVFFIQYIYMCV